MAGVLLTARRAAAYLIDVALLAAVLLPITFAVSIVLGTEELAGFEVWLRSAAMISVPAWAYFVVTEHRWGRGIGKRLLGLRTVTARTDVPPSWSAALLRTAVTLAPWEMTHLAFFAFARRPGEVSAPQVVLASLAYLLLFALIFGTLRSGGRRSPADALAGTEVRPATGSAA